MTECVIYYEWAEDNNAHHDRLLQQIMSWPETETDTEYPRHIFFEI